MTEQVKDAPTDAEKLSGGGAAKTSSTVKVAQHSAASISANERAELHRTIWRIANDLRGSVDGWDFKQYVLGMMFYRFISENLTEYITYEEQEAGAKGFDYAQINDLEIDLDVVQEIVKERGFFLYPSQLFENVYAQARTDENLNETLEKVFQAVEESTKNTQSERNFSGLFDDFDVNSKKLGSSVQDRNKTLYKLMGAVAEMNLETSYRQSANDTFGDAYEYLMGMYAANAGKSGGEYYTPQEVSELLARIATDGKTQVGRVYDPACGSGSLLLKFAKLLGTENVKEFLGQESNPTTYNLCRINMLLHNIPFDKFDIAHGDTLIAPQHRHLEPFEAIVSNPPYSTKWEGDSNPLLINDDRYAPAGVLAPKAKADLAFTMHMLSSLAEDGTAAIVEFPGVLYRGGAERKIREYLLRNNYVDAVIQLPPDLFFGTAIGTCIIVLKKGTRRDTSVLFVDASAEFERVGNKNRLLESHREKIYQAVRTRENVQYFAQLVKSETLLEQDANLSVSSWVEAEDTREQINIGELNAQIEQIVVRQTELRTQIDAIVAELEGTEA